jgi:hypothetical protein
MKEFAKVAAFLAVAYIIMLGAFNLIALIDHTDVTNYEDGSTTITIESEA